MYVHIDNVKLTIKTLYLHNVILVNLQVIFKMNTNKSGWPSNIASDITGLSFTRIIFSEVIITIMANSWLYLRKKNDAEAQIQSKQLKKEEKERQKLEQKEKKEQRKRDKELEKEKKNKTDDEDRTSTYEEPQDNTLERLTETDKII